MSHDTHHDAHAHGHYMEDAKPTTAFNSAILFVLMLIGLFVAAVNFVSVMGHDEGGAHGAHATGHAAPAHHNNEATATQTLEGETGVGVPAPHAAEGHDAAGVDSAHTEGAAHH